ncbi:MAG: hypothetical protein Q7T20_00010 [Saprospiraceae bacterium]|nr:hypothetical protein [Saprospiraceae bacterium]
MKKNMIVRMLCNGLIFFSLLLSQNVATAQEGSGKNKAQEIEVEAGRLTSASQDFNAATKAVTGAARESAKENPDDFEAVKKAARRKLDEEIKKAVGKPYQAELESLKKGWEEDELIAAKPASELDAEAWKKYEKGYTEKTPEDKAKAFEEAAKLFEEAAKAYRKDGNYDKAKAMDGQAEAARKNAKAHGPRESKKEGQEDKKSEQNSIQPMSPKWERISLDGANFKVLPTAPSMPRFHIGLIGSLPLGDINTQSVPMTGLQSAAYAPGTIEQLFEQMQGEFYIGSLSGQSAQNFEMHGTTQAMPGLRLGHRLGNRLELRAGGHYFQSKWSGTFPVVVFSKQQDPPIPPQTLQGSLSASSSGILAEADLAYFFTSGTIRPFVHAGTRGQFPTQNESGATLAGVDLPLETTPLGTAFSPFGGAGMRVSFWENGFIEANTTFGKAPGGDFVPSVGLSVGWRFGNDNSNEISKDDLPLIIQRIYDQYAVYRQFGDSHEDAMKKVGNKGYGDKFKAIYDNQTKRK